MNGNFRQVNERRLLGRSEQLQYTVTAVSDMVAQMQATAVNARDYSEEKYQRPSSTRGKNHSFLMERSKDTGRSQRYCGNKGNRQNKERDTNYSRVNCPRGSEYFNSDKPFNQPSWKSITTKYQHGSNGFRKQGNRSSCQQYLENYDLLTSAGESGQEIDPCQLVKVLVEFPDFRATLLQLQKTRNLDPTTIRNVVSSCSSVFQLNGDILELYPKVSLCLDHAGPKGCQKQSSCSDLHLCPVYLSSWCNEMNCVLGHKWFTDHNKLVLQSFYIKELPVQILRKLIQSVTVAAGPIRQLEICKEYNGKGCSGKYCNALHICQSFVAGLTECTNSGCRLNHDILNSECCQLLREYGFSTNESPREVVVGLLLAYPSFATSTPTHASTVATKNTTVRSSLSNNVNNDSANKTTISSSTSNKNFNSSTNENRYKETEGRQSRFKDVGNEISVSQTRTLPNGVHTVWSHELQGDAVIQQICYYSVEGKCRYESSGCLRLHCSEHYHWQISETGSNWVNLRSNQVANLECAFCDPSQETAELPPLDPEKLDPSVKGLFTLMGSVSWQANLSAMILTNSDYSKVVYLRRLRTQQIPGKMVLSSIYRWYFMDKHKKWVQYGNTDTNGETNLFKSVTSDDIEKHYIQNPGMPLNFESEGNTYILDFNKMIQTNQNTNVICEIRRRPEAHIKRKQGKTPVSEPDVSSCIQTNQNTKVSCEVQQRPEPHLKIDRKQDETLVSEVEDSRGIQTNESTKINREVWRKPEVHLNVDIKQSKTLVYEVGDSSGIPSTWESMLPEERLRLVSLNSSSTEYHSVVNLLNGDGVDSSVTGALEPYDTFSRGRETRLRNDLMVQNLQNDVMPLVNQQCTGNILKIERIQNPCLWRAFQNKVKEMTMVYGDSEKVDVRQLFYGANANAVSSICAENFGRGTYFSPNAAISMDYLSSGIPGNLYCSSNYGLRLHRRFGKSYGQGIYFSPNTATSTDYFNADKSLLKYLFVARVAVGSISQVNSFVARPPINQATGTPYDSAGDGVNVVFKYDKQEYYPEYLIILS